MVNGAFKDCTNYLVTAEDIHGPWSEPVRINGVGFDASLFHDDDGRKYLVQQTWDFREYHHQFDGITLTEFDVDTMKLKPETARTIWDGTSVKITEGPHLYKKDGWYYLFAAEGGTVYEHQESVARSRTLDECSFEVMPNGPFIGNFDTPDTYLQKQGHGALVDTPSGEWYYASLCGRPWRHDTEPAHGTRGWCTLGRETSIQKVEWDEDGWPRVVGGHGGQRYVDAPKDAIETVAPATRDERDEFESDELGLNWNTLRVPFTDAMGTVGGGKLALRGQGSLCNLFDLSLVARRWQAFDFDAETKVRFDPKNYMQMAGLTNYYDDLCWSWAFVTWDEKRHARVIEVAQNDFNQYTSFLKDDAIVVPEDAEAVWLRTKVRKLPSDFLRPSSSWCRSYSRFLMSLRRPVFSMDAPALASSGAWSFRCPCLAWPPLESSPSWEAGMPTCCRCSCSVMPTSTHCHLAYRCSAPNTPLTPHRCWPSPLWL